MYFKNKNNINITKEDNNYVIKSLSCGNMIYSNRITEPFMFLNIIKNISPENSNSEFGIINLDNKSERIYLYENNLHISESGIRYLNFSCEKLFEIRLEKNKVYFNYKDYDLGPAVKNWAFYIMPCANSHIVIRFS